MIPFTRISTYGNKLAPKQKVIKIAYGSDHFAILYDNGNLYTRGSSSSYQLGTGTTTTYYKEFKLVLTNVKDIFCGNVSTIAITNDLKVMHVGYLVGFTGNASSPANQTFTDISTLFTSRGIAVSNIKDIQNDLTATLVLTNDNNLYKVGTGTNSVVGNNSVAITQFTLENASVQSCSCRYNTSMYITTDGRLFRAGRSESGMLGNGTATLTTLPTYTQLTAPASTWKFGRIGNSFTTIQNSTNILYSSGYNIYGQLGRNVATNPITTYGVSFTDGTTLTGTVLDISDTHNGSGVFSLTSTGLWSTGYNTTSGTGNNVNKIKYTACVGVPVLSDYSTIKNIGIITSACSLFLVDGVIYATGTALYLPVLTYSFVVLDLPE